MLNSENGLLNRRRFLALMSTGTATLSGCSESDVDGSRHKCDTGTATTATTDKESGDVENTDKESGDVEKWETYEQSFDGPSSGNPYQDTDFSTIFTHDSGTKRTANGFYDGSGVYRLRFMPDLIGEWTFETDSNASELDGITGSFTAGEPTGDNRGPVVVDPENRYHFTYADGTRFYPFGTTCYGMAQVESKKLKTTLDALDTYGSYQGVLPFNKVRLSAIPHRPTSNLDPNNDDFRDERDETVYKDNNTKDAVNPDWFKLVDRVVEELLARGIQADLILFHLYAHLPPGEFTDADADKLTEYMVSRYGAYRNVWWCLSNEWGGSDWDQRRWNEVGRLVRTTEHYCHLASNHTFPCNDFSWESDWVTHIAAQRTVSECSDPSVIREERSTYGKAYINDEYHYEGDHGFNFETSPKKAAMGHWRSVLGGAYGTHGETHDQQFFRGGGPMHAKSTERIAFLRWIFNQSPSDKGLEPLTDDLHGTSKGDEYFLYYYDMNEPTSKSYDMPESETYQVDVIDTWNMTITEKGEHSGSFTISLPGRKYMAVRMTVV